MLFTFPSRYLFTIGHSVVLSLGEWSPLLQAEFLVLRPTQEYSISLLLRDYHPLWCDFPFASDSFIKYPSAGPISLATTLGVSLDFLSYRYLDVSVPYVRLFTLYILIKIQISLWVPPFGYPRIYAYSQLPAAFRSVSRPSSPLSAKAFTKCPFTLDS